MEDLRELIKVGMLVEETMLGKSLVINDPRKENELLLYNGKEFMRLSSYDSKLIGNRHKEYRVKKIGYSSAFGLEISRMSFETVIWEKVDLKPKEIEFLQKLDGLGFHKIVRFTQGVTAIRHIRHILGYSNNEYYITDGSLFNFITERNSEYIIKDLLKYSEQTSQEK